ncbi:uncharacterized protein LOC126750510 isoform X2 [Anthonomus grandis grandis]|nr:uncharacterized protein LOC126750510 isoform X2 [Anthonomus grandis grandis]XP_050316107.1 uncharacterized protein LOC126750510 isoform X2 [Anthonomus grandis grandis]
MRSRYHLQQQADMRNLRILPLDHDTSENQEKFVDPNRGQPMPDDSEDWKPFEPSFLKVEPTKQDLDAAGSEHKEANDRSYIYVSPKVLTKDFGLDSKTTQHILQTASPNVVTEDQFQVDELQELLGKNPELQLQGLQKLLQDAHPLMGNLNSQPNVADIHVEHNGSPLALATVPQYQSLQEHINAINKAQEAKVLAAAKLQADSHVQAQREAIALAQKQAEKEAYAKIAAHNQGISTLSPDSVEVFSGGNHVSARPHHPVTLAPHVQEIDQNSLELPSEVSPLQGRVVEQVYPGSYGSFADDLRRFKPKRVEGRGKFPVHVTATPLVHTTASPVWSSTVLNSEVDVGKIQVSSTPRPYHHEIKQLYRENANEKHGDLHQYAANYAFGYRIVDEKHGNDFGHEEERKGKNTKGRYYVTLPDGRKQKVDYFADNSGYHARVSYENVAKHPYVPSEEHLIHHKN